MTKKMINPSSLPSVQKANETISKEEEAFMQSSAHSNQPQPKSKVKSLVKERRKNATFTLSPSFIERMTDFLNTHS